MAKQSVTESQQLFGALHSSRFLALDALRGIAILGMLLSGAIAQGIFPAWMYHAQVPPPFHNFDPNLPGITWVDLVFPFFLFALGVSIPLALGRRSERQHSLLPLMGRVFLRGISLTAFAIVLQHFRPHVLTDASSTRGWGIGLLGLLLLFPVFIRLPRSWTLTRRSGVRVLGWVAIAVALVLLCYPDGSGFSVERSDIILILLANAAVGGGLIWLVTRGHWLMRLGAIALLLGLRLGATEPGWVQVVYGWTPVPWVFRWEFMQYLGIVLPATMVGDMLWAWRQGKELDEQLGEWEDSMGGHWRWGAIACLELLTLVVVTVGLQQRWLLATAILAFVLGLMGWWLFRSWQEHGRPASVDLLAVLHSWSWFWLMLGVVLEPYEGGIAKDWPTLSYYFVTVGLAIALLLVCWIAIERWQDHSRVLKWGLGVAIANGQNPMIAYVGLENFVQPVLALTGLGSLAGVLQASLWTSFAYSLFQVMLVALLVQYLTKRGILWGT